MRDLRVVAPRDPLECVLHDFDEVVEIRLAVFIETALARRLRVPEERLEAHADWAFERLKKTSPHHGLLAQQRDHALVGNLRRGIVEDEAAVSGAHPAQQRATDPEAEATHTVSMPVT